MRSKKCLQIHYKTKLAFDDVFNAYNTYHNYVKGHPIEWDVRERRRLFSEWRNEFSNIIDGIYNSKDCFTTHPEAYDKICIIINENVEIPDNLKSNFDDSCDISLKSVLRKARNWGEHVDKVNQEKYMWLADQLDSTKLSKTLIKIAELWLEEFNSFTEDERKLMFVDSADKMAELLLIQKQFSEFMPLLQADDRVTKEQLKQCEDFLKFVPNIDNVIFSSNNEE